MRNFVKFSMLALVAFATTASAAELEFHGYARAGIGLNTEGGRQQCYSVPGQNGTNHWRLGNECDYVIEPNFEYKFTTLEDKSAWGVHIMPSIYKGWGAQTQQTNVTSEVDPAATATTYWYDDLPVRFGQIYFFGNNVPQLLNGTIWGGRRFYDRLQTGINDQFLENEDGDGAGVENMDLGFGKWSVAWLMNPNDTITYTDTDNDPTTPPVADPTQVGSAANKVFKITTRITDIKTMKDGALQIWAGATNLQSKTTGGAKVEAAYRIAAYHTVNLGDYGSNLFGVKYNTTKDLYTLRVIVQHGIMFAAAKTNLDVVVEYVTSKPKGVKATNEFDIGARSDTQLSGPFRFLLEAGYTTVKAGSAKSINLVKITPALAVSGGNDAGSRPTFRLFYTYASSNTEGVVYAAKKSNGSFGVQAEGWW